MTDAEALRRLHRAGWALVRQGRTSHLVMRRGDEQRVFAVGRRGKHRVSRSQRHEVLKATKGGCHVNDQMPLRVLGRIPAKHCIESLAAQLRSELP